jgi:hypothetical protein
VTTTVPIQITDVNDNTPSCSPAAYAQDIAETTATSTTVVTMTGCSDGDTADTLSYTIISGNTNTDFAVDSTGQITLLNTLDWDGGTLTYDLAVQVSSNTNNFNVPVVLSVTPVNEGSPIFSATTHTETIAENSAVDTVIYTYAATDVDYAPHGIVDYTIITFNPTAGSDHFLIDSTSGTIKLAKTLDYESVTSYDLTVKATDGAANTATAVLTVDVTDINDHAIECDPMLYYVTVSEGSASGTSAGTFTNCNTGSTADPEGDSVASYSIDSGDDASAKFQVVSSSATTPAIETTSTALDYETKSLYMLYIIVVDDGNPVKTSTGTVILSVGPVNEATPAWGTWSPAFTSSTTPYNIAENSAVGTSIVTVAATDADMGSDHDVISYSINSVTGDDGVTYSNLFFMDSVTGELNTVGSFDYESTISHYDLVIHAQDGGALYVTETLRVGITDINDNNPAFNPQSYTASVTEGAASSTSVVTLTASDVDSSFSPTYTIFSGNSAGFFTLNAGTANQIDLANVIDLDSPTSDAASYTLVVTVGDGQVTERTATTTVYISVSPTNDHNPGSASVSPSGTINIAETATAGFSVATVTFTDNDYGSQGDITYSITAGDPATFFVIDSLSGAITLTEPMDFETYSSLITLTVSATDGTTAVTTTVPIQITDVNDNTPSLGVKRL